MMCLSFLPRRAVAVYQYLVSVFIIVLVGCSSFLDSSFIDSNLYLAAEPVVSFQSTTLPESLPNILQTTDEFNFEAAEMLIRRRHQGFYDNPLVLMNYLYAVQEEVDHYAGRGDGIQTQFAIGLDGLIEMKSYIESAFAHTQHLDEFCRFPGDDPWGRVQRGIVPEYKKLLPSEMIAMSMYTGRITGKCTSLSALLGGIIVHMDSVMPDDVVFLRKDGHTFGLWKTEDDRILVFNNTHLNQIGPPYLEYLSTEEHTHFFGFGFYAKCDVVIPSNLLSGTETLRAMFERASGFRAIDVDPDPVLIAYALQKLAVPDSMMYIRLSAQLPHTQRLARQLRTTDEIVDWMRRMLSNGSIFPDQEIRVMTSDEVIVFKTGNPLDKAVLLYAVLLNHGQRPLFEIHNNRITVRINDLVVDMHKLTIEYGA